VRSHLLKRGSQVMKVIITSRNGINTNFTQFLCYKLEVIFLYHYTRLRNTSFKSQVSRMFHFHFRRSRGISSFLKYFFCKFNIIKYTFPTISQILRRIILHINKRNAVQLTAYFLPNMFFLIKATIKICIRYRHVFIKYNYIFI